jgi:hypothetical protein
MNDTVSIKKHLNILIKKNDKAIRELFKLHEKYSNEALNIFKDTNNIHLEHLNNTYTVTKRIIDDIASRTVGIVTFEGFRDMTNKRLSDLEAIHLKQEGETKITDKHVENTGKWIYFVIAMVAAFLSSLGTALFVHFIK